MQASLSTNLETDINARVLKDLARGLCVAIPTETVYGLAADATNGEAVARIFEMKGRPAFNPLICHVDGIEMGRYFAEFDEIGTKLAKAFWPGPLTLVLPLKANSDIHPLVSAGLKSVGLRHPKSIASPLITTYGKPLAAPSANRSGRISPTTAQHVMDEFSDRQLTVLDGGACDVGLESTIIKVSNGTITILRPGAITADMIETVIGLEPITSNDGNIEAPGMMKSHYAPNAMLKLNCEDTVNDAPWLQFGDIKTSAHGPTLNLSKSGDLVEAASNLYDFLKQLDKIGAEMICVSPIPDTGLGIAINDRLTRAAAPRDPS